MIDFGEIMGETPTVFGHGGHGGHGGPVKPIPTVVPTPVQFERASDGAHNVLYVVFIIMLISTAVFSYFGSVVPVQKRLYHVITTTIVATAALSYFAMASGYRWPMRCWESTQKNDLLPDTHFYECRQVLWPRYVDWLFTTPLLLLDLCLLAGIDGAHTIIAILADIVMIITGLFASMGTDDKMRWGWYTMGCAAYLVIVYVVAVHGGAQVRARAAAGRVFWGLTIWTGVLWTLYPIVWGIGEGAHKMSLDNEIIAYAILDVLAKVVFGTVLLIAHRRVPETNVEIGGYWAHGLSTEGQIRVGDDDDV